MASRDDKYIYLCITKQKNGKFCAMVHRVASEDNLVPIIGRIENVYSVNVLPRKKAEQLAHDMNQDWKAQGVLDYNIFD